jgi:branched-chain amino acid transport system substrate-binding protein
MDLRFNGRKVTAIVAAVGLVSLLIVGSSSANASSRLATAVSTPSCINKIFGPGGKAAGKGVTIKAGMLLAMTGAGSFFGNVMSKGAKLAAEQIAAAGGFSYKIEIADHKNGDVPTALTEVKRMVLKDKIEVLQTSYGAPSEAIAPIIGQVGVLTLNGGGSSPGQLSKNFLWQNRMLFGEDPTAGALAWIHKKYPSAKKLAIIGTQENGVGAQAITAPKDWALLTGGTVVAAEQHDVGATDFTALASKIKASGADAIMTYSFGNDPGYLVKAFRQAEITAPIMGIEFTQPAQQVAGTAYDTFNFATDFYNVKNPNPWNKCFVTAYRAKYHTAPEYYGSNYYEQVFIYWELVKRVIAAGGNPLSAAQLQAALKKNPTFNSVYGGTATIVGKASFILKDHSISKPMGVFSVKNGEPVLQQEIRKITFGANPNTALVGK